MWEKLNLDYAWKLERKELNTDQDGITLKTLKVVHQHFYVERLYEAEDTADEEVFVK